MKIDIKSCKTCKYFIKEVDGCKIEWCMYFKQWVDTSRVGCIKLIKDEFISEEEMVIV